MTDLPPWAVSGLEALDIDPRSVRREWVKLGPLTQEKGNPWWGSVTNQAWDQVDLIPVAGFTCGECPQRERMYITVERVEGKEGPYDRETRNYTRRCTECERKMKRWLRGQKDAERLEIASTAFRQGISFVTLTEENYIGVDPHEGIRSLKRRVASFRRKFPEDVVSGGKDYYEYTTHSDFRGWSCPWEYNVHVHGVWVMDYWDQESLQSSWSHGIVHVKRAKGKDAIRYCTKYASKADDKGIRLKESFGCLYGSAWKAVELACQVNAERALSDAGDVPV